MKIITLFIVLLVFSTSADAQRKGKRRAETIPVTRNIPFRLDRSDSTVENGYCTYYHGKEIIARGPLYFGSRSGDWEFRGDGMAWNGEFRADTMYGRWQYFQDGKLIAVLNILPPSTYSADTSYFIDNGTSETPGISGIREHIFDSLEVLRLFHENGVLARTDSIWPAEDRIIFKLWDEGGRLISHYENRNNWPWAVYKACDDQQRPSRIDGNLKGGNGKFMVYEWNEEQESQELTYSMNFKDGRLHGGYIRNTYGTEVNGQFVDGFLDGEWHVTHRQGYGISDTVLHYTAADRLEKDTAISDMSWFDCRIWVAGVSPEFYDGEQNRMIFLGSNTNYPMVALEEGIMGRVYVTFFIESSGMIRDVEILRGVHPELDNESLRVVRMMPPWKPGFFNTFPAGIPFNMPINFVLQSN